jgi:pilus assembly protein CpaE
MGKPLMYCVPLSPLTQSYWELVGRYTNRSKKSRTASLPAKEKKGPKKILSWLLGDDDWLTAQNMK